MASGRCTAVFLTGTLKIPCPCTRGEFEVPLATLDVGCKLCAHPLFQHEDASSTSPPSVQNGVSPALDMSQSQPLNSATTNQPLPQSLEKYPYICPRTDTVKKLAMLLDEKRVVHVRGTPSSGKTTLAILLEEYYRKRREPVVFLDSWHNAGNPWIYLANKCKEHGYSGVEYHTLIYANVVLIIDEAQQTYEDRDLWTGILKTQSGSFAGLRICLFSSYGSPTTPIHFGPSQRVSITTSHFSGNGDVCLFYNREEFEDVASRRCSDWTSKFELDPAARAYLYDITNGYPGAVYVLLNFIFRTYRSDLKHHVITHITKDLVIKALDDESTVFEMLEAYPVQRSFPSAKKLTVQAADVLRKVLQHGNIPHRLEDPGTRLCIEEGWVHSVTTNLDTEDVVCVLPSKLHEKFVKYHLGLRDPRPFPFEKFPSLPTFCEAVLRSFSRSNLLLSIEAPAQLRPSEAQFQREWYRAFNSLLGHGFAISSEWSQFGNGRSDFRLVGHKWGVEILLDGDGDRLAEHCNRFLDKGAYHQWIVDGSMEDWIILDCRHSRPQKYQVTGTKLWRVVFKSDYSSVYVLDCNNEEVISEFPLMN